MNKLLTTIFVCYFSISACAVDTYDLATGQLSIPNIVAADGTQITKSFVGTDLIATIKDLISIGESYPASSRVLKQKPDYYDIQFGKLLIPQVIVGDTIYEDLIVTLSEIISIGDVKEVSPSESDFSWEYNLHDSLPEEWKKEFAIIMSNLIDIVPIKSRSGLYYGPIYAWNDNTLLPYKGILGDRRGSSVNGGELRDVGGVVFWLQLEIPNSELENKDLHRYSVIPHEFFHIYQTARSPEFRIKWMMEGNAATFESLYIQQYYSTNYFQEAQTQVDIKYINDPKLLESYESLDNNYSSSVFFTLALAKELQKLDYSEVAAFRLIFKEFYDQFPTTENWEMLFLDVFKMSVDDFYTKLKAYTNDINTVIPSEILVLQDIFND